VVLVYFINVNATTSLNWFVEFEMCIWGWYAIFRVTTCLENLEMSENLTAITEMSEILLKIREMSGKKSCQGKVA